MKIIKKIAAIMLSVMMVLGMCSVVGAEGAGTTSGTSADKGKITIDNAIVGQTYTIYQILELESFSDKTIEPNTGNYAYKPTSAWKQFVSDAENESGVKYFIKDGEYVKWNPEVGTDATVIAKFAKEALEYAGKSNINFTQQQKNVTNTTVEFNDLSLGYYLVDSSTGALCSLDTTAKEVTIKEKNGVPSVEKKVQEDSKINTIDEYGESNTADIGQTVNFKTTITAQAGAQSYVLHDKMEEGLTFSGNVSVTKGTQTFTTPTDYRLVMSPSTDIKDDCTFEIVFTQNFCDKLQAGDEIVVTYSATLNEKAVIAGEGNKNETWLKYGDSSETTHKTTTTKTYEIPVFKYTEKTDGNKTGLPNAEFTLSKSEKGTNPIELVDITAADETNKTYRVATEIEKSASPKGTITTVTTPSTGKFTIQGLDADTYYLTETKQPDGYNKLTTPVTIVIKEDGTITVGGETITSTNPVKVENKSGSLLPSTGGMGTTLFYIFGAILVIGSGVVLITKKRMK